MKLEAQAGFFLRSFPKLWTRHSGGEPTQPLDRLRVILSQSCAPCLSGWQILGEGGPAEGGGGEEGRW